ncbi:helix-turn-helix domain-containing protein [Proteus terrae]
MNLLEKTGTTLEGKKKAAEILGISIATLYRKIKI